MRFLTKYLWNIFALAQEENEDMDTFVADLAVADDLFVSELDKPETAYRCLAALDRPALAAEWAACGQAEAKAEYQAVVSGAEYPALCRAFTAGDGAGFAELRAHALADLEERV